MDTKHQASPSAITHRPRQNRRGFLALTHALVAHRRMAMTDRLLATLLAGVAGAVNAGGFFVVGKYTSHMTGYVSQVADSLATGNFAVAFASIVAIFSFLSGAITSSIMVVWARLHRSHFQYALPIMVQGASLFAFSLSGRVFSSDYLLVQLAWLCYLMGMQNATITKLSRARVRTTHVTGMVTDIGIETGRALFGRMAGNPHIKADWRKLSTLLRIVFAYLVGGIMGAIGFASVGFYFAMPLALILLTISLPMLLKPVMKRKTVRP
ncbi:MAG: YoaK family protein [Aestuariivirga sp.]